MKDKLYHWLHPIAETVENKPQLLVAFICLSAILPILEVTNKIDIGLLSVIPSTILAGVVGVIAWLSHDLHRKFNTKRV